MTDHHQRQQAASLTDPTTMCRPPRATRFVDASAAVLVLPLGTVSAAALPDLTEIAMVVFLVFVLLQLGGYVLLFRKPRADEALVRTGAGEVQVTVGRGIFRLPFLHRIERVSLRLRAITYDLTDENVLLWTGGESFGGRLIVNLQVPAESPPTVAVAARNLPGDLDDAAVAAKFEGIFRTAVRDTLRSFRRITFDIEPTAVEVRLTQALDQAAAPFGVRIRSVNLVELGGDTSRARAARALRTLAVDESGQFPTPHTDTPAASEG